MVLYSWFRFNAGFCPPTRLCCVFIWHRCNWNVAELFLLGLPQIHTDSPILSSDSGSFGLAEWSSWSFLKLPWQRLVGYWYSVTVSVGPQSEQKQNGLFNIFLITPTGWTADWTHLNIFYCIPHICIKTFPWSYFVLFHKLTTIIYRNWNWYFSRRKNYILWVSVFFFFFHMHIILSFHKDCIGWQNTSMPHYSSLLMLFCSCGWLQRL